MIKIIHKIINRVAPMLIAAAAILPCACNRTPKLDITLPSKFEGQQVEIVNFLDSTVIASGIVENGRLELVNPGTDPVFASVMIDGRTRAFYIVEPGHALLNDSISSATGTPLNDLFSDIMLDLDSVDNLDDMSLYLDFVRKAYDAHRTDPIGSYLGMEFIKYADLPQIDSLLSTAPENLAASSKTKHYRDIAELRAATAPGQPYVDFEGETETGKPLPLSKLVNKDGFTLVDFWASWCPYCIKELPALAALQEKYPEPQLKIVGVAVRDLPEDTKGAIGKHGISWPVIYNTQRKPYEIYGFTGIPHHILIAPDGTIVSRGESVAQIANRLSKELPED